MFGTFFDFFAILVLSWIIMASNMPARRPRSPLRRLQDRPRRLQEASRRLQDVQDRLQDASKIAQEASKRLPDASKTAKIPSKTPPRLPNRLPNAFLAPKSPLSPSRRLPEASRCLPDAQHRFQDRPKCSEAFSKAYFPARFMPSPCQVPKYARDFCPQWPSTMADCQVRGRVVWRWFARVGRLR